MNDESDTPFISFAQHGEDVVLLRAFADQPTGWYVDVGAFDPTVDSVTRVFYERGWRGINIDPSVEAIDRFRLERPEDINLAVAVGAEDGEADLHVTDVPGWATIDEVSAAALDQAQHVVRRVKVPVRRLSGLLDELPAREIDFLKIDAEGAEPQVVAGLDLKRHRPRVIVLEGIAPGAAESYADSALRALERAGYLRGCFDGLNHYLTRDPSLLLALSRPANPNDRFVKHSVIELEAYTARLEAVLADRESVLAEQDLRLKAIAENLNQAEEAIREREEAIREREETLREREETLRLVLSSHSWRLTAPLRAARHMGQRVHDLLYALVSAADRLLRRVPRARAALIGVADRHPRLAGLLRGTVESHREAASTSKHPRCDVTSARRISAVSALEVRERLRIGGTW